MIPFTNNQKLIACYATTVSCEFDWLYHANFRQKQKIYISSEKKKHGNFLENQFCPNFSCCPKNLSCPKLGGAAAPPAPPARTPRGSCLLLPLVFGVLCMPNVSSISSVEKFSCVAVFVICDGILFDKYIETCVVEKLVLIPGHAKLVVSPFGWKSIGKVPETLHVMYPTDERHTPFTCLPNLADQRNSSIFISWMIEIFNKRWQTLDFTSMMQELQRACYIRASYRQMSPVIIIKDNLSTRLRFQKTEVKSSLKETSDSATGI